MTVDPDDLLDADHGSVGDDQSLWDTGPALGNRGPHAVLEPLVATPIGAALGMASRGGLVFPVHTPDGAGGCSCRRACDRGAGKHPRTHRGLVDATTDANAIRHWWNRWPDANVGLRTGAISGLFVIDVDPEGYGPFDDLCERHGSSSGSLETWLARTGREGAHLYLRHPGGDIRVKTSAGELAIGVDVRGDGGYVIVPPSRHASGTDYVWVPGCAPDQCSLTEAPTWLLPHVIQDPRMVRSSSNPSSGGSSSRRMLQRAIGEAIREGQRNIVLTSLAGSMRRRGFGRNAITAALVAENAERCRPPLRPDEIEAIARSVARYGPAATDGSDGSPAPTVQVAGLDLPVRRRGSHRG